KGTMRVKFSSPSCKGPSARKGKTFNVREALMQFQNKETQRRLMLPQNSGEVLDSGEAPAPEEDGHMDDSNDEDETINNNNILSEMPNANITRETNSLIKSKRIRKDFFEPDEDTEIPLASIMSTLEVQSGMMKSLLEEFQQLKKEMKEKDDIICGL